MISKTGCSIGTFGISAILLAGATPGAAQPTDYEAIVRIMRECARIGDMAARVACYDNTIGAEKLINGQAESASPSERVATPAPLPRSSRAASAPRACARDRRPGTGGTSARNQ
ncbi:hypothetical protein FHS61_000321 [Altererythrobacter atlanticus]|uniref:Uncharacterized protein n=1 Tax=Croceibacterium atlanticum TaxID=1267766 RepID=A0A0F7KTS5_9SPHN|nr:hypothetical protein [Croceibacterium atlanticum]AKH42551.1 hypothetical protein WYH_01512 [Croceibacterium atlanticum]MBB5731328.1 hypothetical protein [Croceibacterium atlanticum]